MRFPTAFFILFVVLVGIVVPVYGQQGQDDVLRFGSNNTNSSPYDVDIGMDLGLTVGFVTVFGLPDIVAREAVRPWCGLDCNKNDINSLDRYVVGKDSRSADMFSDIGLGVSDAFAFVFTTLDVLIYDPGDGWTGWAKDTLVLAETLSLTLATTNLLKYVVRRPRPFVYDQNVDDKIRMLADSSLSFPSGHTSSSFAMATAYSFTFMYRHPHSPWVVPVWIGTLALAAAVGVSRTEAGEHFYTDVIAGAVIGAGMGLLVPYLHLHESESFADGRDGPQETGEGNSSEGDSERSTWPSFTILPLLTSSGGALVLCF